ncbi:hypothetical protein M0804_014263 [Polistes exclamans]|nr:hypothetical protein M0804_014265 [Polistes exclamans]KAI4475524.1 hypothetical protein M0804_014263 [Polistes exclamans]
MQSYYTVYSYEDERNPPGVELSFKTGTQNFVDPFKEKMTESDTIEDIYLRAHSGSSGSSSSSSSSGYTTMKLFNFPEHLLRKTADKSRTIYARCICSAASREIERASVA